MSIERDRKASRRKRHLRARRKFRGTPQRPRLCVSKTLNHIYAQVIDDLAGRTLCAASTREAGVADDTGQTGNVAAAAKVGALIGERAMAAGLKQVVFDRTGNPYHGRIKAVAEAAREAGLDF